MSESRGHETAGVLFPHSVRVMRSTGQSGDFVADDSFLFLPNLPNTLSPQTSPSLNTYRTADNEYAQIRDDFDFPDSPQVGGLTRGWRGTLKNLGLQLALIIVFTAEVIVRKATTSIYMVNYRTVLNFILVLACTFVFFLIVAYKQFVTKTLPRESSISWRLLVWYCTIAVFDTVGMMTVLISAAYITAPVSTLLSQGVIPITILLSIVFFKKRYHALHYVGSLVLFGGIALSVVFSKTTTAEGSSSGSSSLGWCIVFFLSNVPNAISSLLKEVIMCHPTSPAEMNSLNAYVALVQVLLSVALAPASFLLQNPSSSPHGRASELPENVVDGFLCWTREQNFVMDTDYPDECSGALWVVTLHIVLIVLLNIMALLVIFYGSAAIFWIASACAIPLTAIVLWADYKDIVATVVTLAGLIIYRLKPETVADPADPPSPDSRLQEDY